MKHVALLYLVMLAFIAGCGAINTNSSSSSSSSSANPIIKIAAGMYHSVVLKNDGTVYTFGYNSNGELGYASSGNYVSSPQKVPTLDNVSKIVCGYSPTVALKNDGSLWMFGSNSITTPSQLANISNISTIDVGGYEIYALTSAGILFGQGENFYGQFGNGSTTSANALTQLTNFSDITVVSGGQSYTLAIKSNGTLLACGENSSGQLGDGTTINRTTPVTITDITGNIVAVSAGFSHSLLLKSDGTVWATGYNSSGALGNGTTQNRTTFAQVSSLNNVVAIECGTSHSIALKNDGSVYAWGANNSYGTLGNGSTDHELSPVQVSSLSNITVITTYGYHNLALDSSGNLFAWGWNGYGQLGDGTQTDRKTPVQISF